MARSVKLADDVIANVRLDTIELREEEAITWLDSFTERMSTPSTAEHKFFANRRKLGQGVGLDAGGNLIHAGSHAAV